MLHNNNFSDVVGVAKTLTLANRSIKTLYPIVHKFKKNSFLLVWESFSCIIPVAKSLTFPNQFKKTFLTFRKTRKAVLFCLRKDFSAHVAK